MIKTIKYGWGAGVKTGIGCRGHEHPYRFNKEKQVWEAAGCLELAGNGICTASPPNELPRGHKFNGRVLRGRAACEIEERYESWEGQKEWEAEQMKEWGRND